MEILWLPPVAALLLGYLLGSIPFGLLLAKAAGVGDLRKIGSGNIGATNVLRTGKKGTAAATLLFDIGKGVAAVLVGMFLMDGGGVLGGAAAFFGHCYPVWRSEEHTSELQSLMRISYAVFCLIKEIIIHSSSI